MNITHWFVDDGEWQLNVIEWPASVCWPARQAADEPSRSKMRNDKLQRLNILVSLRSFDGNRSSPLVRLPNEILVIEMSVCFRKLWMHLENAVFAGDSFANTELTKHKKKNTTKKNYQLKKPMTKILILKILISSKQNNSCEILCVFFRFLSFWIEDVAFVIRLRRTQHFENVIG